MEFLLLFLENLCLLPLLRSYPLLRPNNGCTKKFISRPIIHHSAQKKLSTTVHIRRKPLSFRGKHSMHDNKLPRTTGNRLIYSHKSGNVQKRETICMFTKGNHLHIKISRPAAGAGEGVYCHQCCHWWQERPLPMAFAAAVSFWSFLPCA